MTQTDNRWGRDLADAGLPGLVEAVLDPLGHLAEPEPSGQAGAYWPQPPVGDRDADAARDRAVGQALAALEALLTTATRTDGRRTPDGDLRARTMLLSAVDRALSDPASGYLKRLRQQRSALLRERLARGATYAALAAELGVSDQRVRALVQNNRSYVSASRQLALQALREQGEAERAARRGARDAERQAARAAALEARIREGRALAARIANGEDRDALIATTGYSRQRIAALLAEVRRADTEGQATR